MQVTKCDVYDGAVGQKRNKSPNRANPFFCTTDKTNSPPTDQSVDYSVLSPRTKPAPDTTDESRGKAEPGGASQSQAEPGSDSHKPWVLGRP